MSFFTVRGDTLCAENVPVRDIANRVGTPCYIYSKQALENAWLGFDSAFGDYPHLVCFAVKANSNIGVLNTLAKLGAGFDIVSGGELQRVIAAGGDPSNVFFSGVAKSREEIAFALEQQVRSINIESPAELDRVQSVAVEVGKIANISVRVNPDVDPQTHPYISTGLEEAKFGVSMQDSLRVFKQAKNYSHTNVFGVAYHIGSQITSTAPFEDALDRVISLIKTLAEMDINIEHLDMGGGYGIVYNEEELPSQREFIQTLLNKLDSANIKLPVSIEPGRSIAGNAGILVTEVSYLKENTDKNFAIIDAAMNDLMRPSLYDAWHTITPITTPNNETVERVYDVVGPVCETGDILGKNRRLAIEHGDLLAIHSTGAYGFTMSSNYNTRPRAAEVLVNDKQWQIIRDREATTDLFALESIPSWA